jgi:hypothetical protein
MKTKFLLVSLWLALVSGSAHALVTRPLSEPGIFELLGLGAVVALVVAIRRHHK